MCIELIAAATPVLRKAKKRMDCTVNRATHEGEKVQLHTVAALIQKYRAVILELIGRKIRAVIITGDYGKRNKETGERVFCFTRAVPGAMEVQL